MTSKIVFRSNDGSVGIVSVLDETLDLEQHASIAVPVVITEAGEVSRGVVAPFSVKKGDQIDARTAILNELSFKQLEYKIIESDALPTDRLFRPAWVLEGNNVSEGTEKAKEIAHDLRRISREAELSPLDKEISFVIGDAIKVAEVEAQRQEIRNKYEQVETEIDSVSNVEELRAVIQANLQLN